MAASLLALELKGAVEKDLCFDSLRPFEFHLHLKYLEGHWKQCLTGITDWNTLDPRYHFSYEKENGIRSYKSKQRTG